MIHVYLFVYLFICQFSFQMNLESREQTYHLRRITAAQAFVVDGDFEKIRPCWALWNVPTTLGSQTLSSICWCLMFFFEDFVMVEWDLMRILWWVNGNGILLGLNGDISWEPSHFDDVVFWSMLQPNLLQLCFTIHQHCNPDLDHSRENPQGVPRNLELSKMVWRMNFPTSDIMKFWYFWSCLASSWLLVWNLVMRYITTISQNNL